MFKKLVQKIFGTEETPQVEMKTEPRIIDVSEHQIDPAKVSKNAVRVTRTLQEAGYQAYVVGGAVRDMLLGASPKDFDIATNATPPQVKKLFRRAFIIGKRFQIVHVMFGPEMLEVTTFRGASIEDAKKDEHGRVLRDNTFGEQYEDAARRDFSINAMYYDPISQKILDYHDGMRDIRQKLLRIIGVPEVRYREDPVRMLRVVRFAAKLGFDIDSAAHEPIRVMAPLVDNVPAARVYDEMLKLLLGGHAVACVRQLRKEGLHHGLLPLLDVVMEQPLGERFVSLALAKTDERVQRGKSTSPGFLFAALLWHQVVEKWDAYRASGEYPIPALHLAVSDVLDLQTEKLALQRKMSSDMRELWALQPRFERRAGKTPYRLLEHPRFRAAYDFLLLRCEAGELDAAIGEWWTSFAQGTSTEREELIAQRKQQAGTKAKKRSSRRGGRGRKKDDATETQQISEVAV